MTFSKIPFYFRMITLMGKNWLLNKFQPPVSILLYHRIENLNHEEDPERLAVSPENFNQHLKYLKENFNVISPDKINQVRTPSIIISFDDGYSDNFHKALPLLEKHGLPATFFVTTGFLNNKITPYWDWLLIQYNSLKAPLSFKSEVLKQEVYLNPQQTETYQMLSATLKSQDPGKREGFRKELEQISGNSSQIKERDRFLTMHELKGFSEHPLVTIGAHTQQHPRLSSLPRQEQQQEVELGKLKLEKIIGKPITLLAYPFGMKEDYNAQSIEISKMIGFQYTFSNFRGQLRANTPKHQVPRYLVRNWGIDKFKHEVFRSFLMEDT